MNLFWAALIVVLVAVVATTAMLLVRRRAPEGSYFEDGDRAAGVFGVLGLRPVAMQRTVAQLTHEKGIANRRFQIPCDAQGARL